MAGGMGRRDVGLSLAERSGLMEKERKPKGRVHCWVIGEGGERWPGLLLEWRRRSARWEGLVSYIQPAGDSYKLVQGWLDGEASRSTGKAR